MAINGSSLTDCKNEKVVENDEAIGEMIQSLRWIGSEHYVRVVRKIYARVLLEEYP